MGDLSKLDRRGFESPNGYGALWSVLTVEFEQVEGVVRTLRTVSESRQHLDVGDVQGGRQQVSGMAQEFVETNL